MIGSEKGITFLIRLGGLRVISFVDLAIIQKGFLHPIKQYKKGDPVRCIIVDSDKLTIALETSEDIEGTLAIGTTGVLGIVNARGDSFSVVEWKSLLSISCGILKEEDLLGLVCEKYERGVVVEGAKEEGKFFKAGLRKGDIIRWVSGYNIREVETVVVLFLLRRKEYSTAMTVRRGEKTYSTTLVVYGGKKA